MTDFYGDIGCCLTCEDAHDDCLCFDCKCTQCDYYEGFNGDGYCSIASDWSFQNKKLIEVDISEPEAETEKAWLMSVNGSNPIWIPKKILKNGKLPYWFLKSKKLVK
jgi:hypothetical protein